MGRMKVFITGCAAHIRIWDAVSGGIKCVIEHKAGCKKEDKAEITDFVLDDRGRKVFIADHDGEIHAYNVTTGTFIKKLTKHSKEVCGLIYCAGDQNIISVSWDRSVVVHDESEKSAKYWRKCTTVHMGDITCVVFSRHLGLIATGSTDYVISIRDYERLRTVSSLVGHKSDITALAFIEPFALLASADVSGYVAIWAVPAPGTKPGHEHRHMNCVLTRFINMQSLENSPAVTTLDPVWKEGQLVLYAG